MNKQSILFKIFVIGLSFVFSFHITETQKPESKAPASNSTEAINATDIQDMGLKKIHESLSEFSSEKLDEFIAANQDINKDSKYLGSCTRWRIVDKYCDPDYVCYYGKRLIYIYSRTCFWGVETKFVYGNCCNYYW